MINDDEIGRAKELYGIAVDLLENKNKYFSEKQPDLNFIDGIGVSFVFSSLVLAQFLKFMIKGNPDCAKDESMREILSHVSDIAFSSAKIDLKAKSS